MRFCITALVVRPAESTLDPQRAVDDSLPPDYSLTT